MSRIDVRTALASDELCLDNLMQFYAYDASEWYPIDLHADGRFKLRPVARFWTDESHRPFLIFVDDKLAGFAVVDCEVVDPLSQWNIGYFFIARRFRGKGVGNHVAQKLFAQFRGRWEVYQLVANVNAIAFWRKTIAEFTKAKIEEHMITIHGDACVQQRFRS
jgi:predicted acetyltransferase